MRTSRRPVIRNASKDWKLSPQPSRTISLESWIAERRLWVKNPMSCVAIPKVMFLGLKPRYPRKEALHLTPIHTCLRALGLQRSGPLALLAQLLMRCLGVRSRTRFAALDRRATMLKLRSLWDFASLETRP